MNSALRRLSLALLAGAVLLAPPALAKDRRDDRDDDDRAKTKLVVLEGPRRTIDWYGNGGVNVTVRLCIGSSTGAFRLSVLPSSGLAPLVGDAQASIALEVDGGQSQPVPFDGRAPSVFTGRTNPSDFNCSGGGNARLILSLPEKSLTAVSSGQYFDQLQLQLEAL